jgi:hypothetical protein
MRAELGVGPERLIARFSNSAILSTAFLTVPGQLFRWTSSLELNGVDYELV